MIPFVAKKDLKFPLVNCVPLSETKMRGNPNRANMYLRLLIVVSDDAVFNGMTSIHFVKASTMMSR